MLNKDFILQRIFIYAGQEFDPLVDEQVTDVLRSRLNINLPQKSSLNQSLDSTISDHEIISLILQYRAVE